MNPMFGFAILIIFVCSFIVTLLLVPLIIKMACKFGAIEHGGYRKVNDLSIPLLGGIAVAIPIIVVTVLGLINYPFCLFHHIYNRYLIVFLVGIVAILLLGMIDDVLGLRARVKLLFQVLIATLICFSGYALSVLYIPFVGRVILGPIWGDVISICWIVGLINAFNLIDGIDGLASGVACIAALSLAILGAISSNSLVVVMFIVLAGSLLGFLFYNFYPAKIFLGDTGSMFIGYSIAMLTLIGSYKSETAIIVFAPLLALGLPIFETMISMVRRYIRGKPIFTADGYHTHHRLLRKGYSQRKVALMLYFVALLFSGWAILARLLPDEWEWVSFVLFAITVIWVAWIAGYLSSQSVRNILQHRQSNLFLTTFSKYVCLSLEAHCDDKRISNLLIELCRCELHLHFLSVSFPDGSTWLKSTESNNGGAQDECIQDKLCVQAAAGRHLMIHYQFRQMVDLVEKHDVDSCLAAIFSDIRLAGPLDNIP